MVAPRTHIIGAGLAGLSTAVNLVKAGREVSVHEAAGHAGGRCRSFDDAAIGRRIDNGNHLLLSGNRAALDYLTDIGAEDSLSGPEVAEFPFLDLKTSERWTVKPDAGLIPWSIFSKARRVPGSRATEYLKAISLAWAGDDATVAECLGPDGVLFRRFWEPLSVAVLNTCAEESAASLFWPVVLETLGRGEAACRPLIAGTGLSESFVDPAVRFLRDRGIPVNVNSRLRGLLVEGARVSGLDFGTGHSPLGADDSVVLAVPPAAAADLVPDLKTPNESRAIVNGHFLLEKEIPGFSFLGLVGGLSQWLFVRGDVAAVTVSAANDLAGDETDSIAERLWEEIAVALDLRGFPLPPHRIVKEKRATFAQTPEQVKLRRRTATAWKNLFLAGDWTDTGLPATIEGTVRSGRKACESILISTS